MSAQLRSGSLGPPTLFFILHSKYNSHEGADLVSALFKYYHLSPLTEYDRPRTLSLKVHEDWSLRNKLELKGKYLNVFFNIFTNNQHPELQMQNRAEPSTTTTVVNCYKRELVSPTEIIQIELEIHRQDTLPYHSMKTAVSPPSDMTQLIWAK